VLLSAQLLDTYDRCPRRFAFERTHEPRSISLLGLLYAGVEGALMGDPDAISRITQRLDVNAGDLSPLSAVRHVECMAEVIGLALREKLGVAQRLEPVPLLSHEWQSNLFECRGTLHRIILTSYLDDDSLRSFAHSWQTIGELAALERSITLTVVIIGAQRGGRRHSPWAKGFLHPIQKTLRIGRRKAGGADGFTTGWKEVWREQTEIKAETWLERMKADEMLGDLIVSRKITYRGEDPRMVQAREDIHTFADQMGEASLASDLPLRRSSCDEIGRGPCPFQPVCYSSTPVTPDDLPHLYRAKETPLVTLGAGTSANHSGARRP
jgi:hypothetical protein